MTAQNHGKRETSRHLHVAYNTVLSTCHRVRKKVSTL
ncbi:hypothetical protein [Vibrio kanaloae]